jgi:hypothetical protein
VIFLNAEGSSPYAEALLPNAEASFPFVDGPFPNAEDIVF